MRFDFPKCQTHASGVPDMHDRGFGLEVLVVVENLYAQLGLNRKWRGKFQEAALQAEFYNLRGCTRTRRAFGGNLRRSAEWDS